jgi:hypothetical protein
MKKRALDRFFANIPQNQPSFGKCSAGLNITSNIHAKPPVFGKKRIEYNERLSQNFSFWESSLGFMGKNGL